MPARCAARAKKCANDALLVGWAAGCVVEDAEKGLRLDGDGNGGGGGVGGGDGCLGQRARKVKVGGGGHDCGVVSHSRHGLTLWLTAWNFDGLSHAGAAASAYRYSTVLFNVQILWWLTHD